MSELERMGTSISVENNEARIEDKVPDFAEHGEDAFESVPGRNESALAGKIPDFDGEGSLGVDNDGIDAYGRHGIENKIPDFPEKSGLENDREVESKNIHPSVEVLDLKAAEGTTAQPIVRSCYVNADGLPKNLPRSDGSWTGEPGNSVWTPDPDYVPQKGNPEGKTWKEILDKYGIEGIPFNDGEPDFSEIAEAEVQVDEIGEDRDENFANADEALAEQWTKDQKDGHDWTPEDVRNYRKENHLTWHECGDRKTMQLVPAEVHSNVPHSGGVSAAKTESTVTNTESEKA